jgi:phosphatidylserine/phosphatidylglycerophosphate/cardiolipin synthase-like enzyme
MYQPAAYTLKQHPTLKTIVCHWNIFIIFFVTLTLASGTDVEVFFSPNGGATDAVVGEINRAQRRVLVQAYTFSSVPIAIALVSAKKRGVEVEAILDKSNVKEGYSSITFMEKASIPVYIDDRVKIAHSKIMIIDGKEIITGSFNFTMSGECHNAENLLILRNDLPLVSKYLANYRWRLSLSHKAIETGLGRVFKIKKIEV